MQSGKSSIVTVHVPPGLSANTKPNTRIVAPQKSSWASRQRVARTFEDSRPPPIAATAHHKPPTLGHPVDAPSTAAVVQPAATSLQPAAHGPAAALAAALNHGRANNHVHPLGQQNGAPASAPPPLKQKPKVRPRGPLVKDGSWETMATTHSRSLGSRNLRLRSTRHRRAQLSSGPNDRTHKERRQRLVARPNRPQAGPISFKLQRRNVTLVYRRSGRLQTRSPPDVYKPHCLLTHFVPFLASQRTYRAKFPICVSRCIRVILQFIA